MTADTLRSIGHHSVSLVGDPRALAPSIDGARICIGLRDGSVAIFHADAAAEGVHQPLVVYDRDADLHASALSEKARRVPVSASWQEPIRALCHVIGPWWLVPKTEGRFRWLRVETANPATADQPDAQWIPVEVDQEECPSGGLRPTYIGMLRLEDGSTSSTLDNEVDLIVSYARTDKQTNTHCSLIYRVTLDHNSSKSPRLRQVENFQDLGRLRNVTRIEGYGEMGSWLLVGYTGKFSVLIRNAIGQYELRKNISVTWTAGESGVAAESSGWNPALVNDVTAVRGRNRAPRNEVIVSTDIGAFALRITPNNAHASTASAERTELVAETQRLDHAGLRGVPLGVACTTVDWDATNAATAYVWCYDSLGGVHLYEGRVPDGPAAQAVDGRPSRTPWTAWNRVQSQVSEAPAVTAVAFQAGSKLVVWQNCRDESVAVTRYSLHAAADVENADAITTLQTLEAARLWLARVYKVRDRHCGDVNSGPGTSPARDPASHPEWVVAEIFDPPPACATKLWEFLAHPGIELAIAAIHKICEEEREDFARASRLRESIDLWVQTLVGTLHRLNPPFRDDLALGIVRWLHRLSQWASDYKGQKMAVRSGAPSVARAADDAVFDVRRWTLFAPQTGKHAGASGHPSQERPYRPGIAYQLSRLDGLVARKDAMRRELEEAVVKESLLFHHRIDEEAVVSHDALFKESNREPTTQPQQVRGAPYHVAWLDLTQADTALCSVVFRQQCIKLFDVDIAPEFKSHDSATVPHRLRLRSTIPLGTASRFGRAAVLWSSEGRRCLLTTKNHGSGEQLCLYDVTERAWAPIFCDDVSESNPDLGSDCVYSFHFVEEASNRWGSSHTAVVLMGVRRDDGCAEFEILHITLPLLTTGGSPRYALARTTVRLADARGSAIPNPVHCLHYVAQKRPRAESHHYYIVAGCDDGTVFLIEGTDLSTFAEARPRIVARLAAPVWTIQCRLLRDRRVRVYAGTADGHIVAWEQLPPKQVSAGGLSPRQEPAAWEFAGLWSTREGRGIVSLSSFAAPLNEPDQASPLLLAVSRNGRATLFADHEHVDARGHEGRPRVPGQRLERFNLQSTAFASATVQVTKALGTERPRLPPVVRLIVATGDGDVRLVALHQPKRSEIRKQRYGMLGEVWFRSLCPPDSTQIEPRRLRYTEALRAMAPGIWLLPVRFFIPTSAEDVAAGYQKVLRNIHPDWFPLHLRNYVRAAQAHASVMRALLDPQFNAKTMLAHADVMCRELEQALRDAHELNDKKLFQEITLSVGLGLNAALLHVCADTTLALAARVARDECMEQLYTRVLEVLEQACRPWLTSDIDAYAQVQIVRVKNLVDGRVLYHLATHQWERKHLQDLIRARVMHVQRVLREANSLIPLEALCAVNLSLLRAASIMTDADRAWPNHKTFIAVISAFAAQASPHAGDALTHELARVHALCLALAPHEATRVALSMRAGELPEALVLETQLQLRLLPVLLGQAAPAHELQKYREQAKQLFERCLESPPARPDKPAIAGPAAVVGSVGEAFERELHSWSEAYAPCRRAAELLSEATQALHSAPEQVSFRSIEGLQQKLTTSQSKARDNSNGHFFELDRKYFGEQLGALREICERYSISTQQGAAVSSEYERARRLAADDAPVAPAVLLASPELRRWARSAKDALGRARIPDPRRRHYREALDDFEAVTGSLRTSSAVQRRLVTGVLGHHLMEAMEEHVLRLAETAHVLYPRTLLNADHESSVEHHAAALSDQAEQARAIPKNLRALYQLLMTGRETQTRIQSLRRSQAEQPSAGVLVVDIFDQAFSAEQLPKAKIKYDKKSSRKVLPAVAASLGLVFGELASNHRVHGKLIGDAELNDEGTSIGHRYEVVVGVPAAPNLDRLIDVALGAFQGFSPPNDAVEESSGVGLYLANLAASVVGWNLSLRGQDNLRNMFSIDHELTPEDYRAAHEQVLSNNTISFIVSERRP